MRYATRTVSTKRPGHGEFKAEVEVPQAESWAEIPQWIGSEEKALEFFNGAAATGAVNGSRAYARNAPEGESNDDILEKTRTVAHGYVPTGAERGPSKKERLATFDSLMARVRSGQEVSNEELEAIASKFGA